MQLTFLEALLRWAAHQNLNKRIALPVGAVDPTISKRTAPSWSEIGEANVEVDHFGGCPTCGKNQGHVNAGRTHVFFCKDHGYHGSLARIFSAVGASKPERSSSRNTSGSKASTASSRAGRTKSNASPWRQTFLRAQWSTTTFHSEEGSPP
jgi:hypothetical protein